MTTRMSEVTPEAEPEECLAVHWDEPQHESRSDGWPECEFEGCSNPVSFKMNDRFGETHRACTDHEGALDSWVRIHNGWDEPASEEDTDDTGDGEGTLEDEA